MGTFIGHILPGAGFFLLGLWHLYNTLGAYVRSPWHFKSRTWFFPHGIKPLRHAELYFIMLGSCISIAAELFICPQKHQPWAEDWSIPPEHLNNFEHSTISMFMLIYATTALMIDIFQIHVPRGWVPAMAAIALSQEFLLFHFHSADHMGLEGHYHWLLQLPIAVGILALLVEIVISQHLPVVVTLRSMSILLQGTWFIQMGITLWTPSLLPKGCSMTHGMDEKTVRCVTEKALMQAKALANLQFSWHIAGIVVFTAVLFATLSTVIPKQQAKYLHLDGSEEDNFEGEDSPGAVFKIGEEDVEHGGGSPSGGSQGSVELQVFDGIDLER